MSVACFDRSQMVVMHAGVQLWCRVRCMPACNYGAGYSACRRAIMVQGTVHVPSGACDLGYGVQGCRAADLWFFQWDGTPWDGTLVL